LRLKYPDLRDLRQFNVSVYFQANQRVEEFKRQLKTLTVKLKEAEARAEFAEKTVKKLQKEVDRLEGAYISKNKHKHYF